MYIVLDRYLPPFAFATEDLDLLGAVRKRTLEFTFGVLVDLAFGFRNRLVKTRLIRVEPNLRMMDARWRRRLRIGSDRRE